MIMSEKYIELPREKIEFYGNTEEEKKAKELIFDLTLENDNLSQKNKELRDKNLDLQQIINKAIKCLCGMKHLENGLSMDGFIKREKELYSILKGKEVKEND